MNDSRLVKSSFPLSKNNKRCLSSLGTILGRVQYPGLPLYFAHCTPSEIREAWSSCVTSSLVFEKGTSNKAPRLHEERYAEQFSAMIRQFARNVGFEDTDQFLKALPPYKTNVQYRSIFAELVNNKASGGPGLSLDHLPQDRGGKYPGLEDTTINTRLQIPIHPFALLSALPFEFSLLEDAAGDLGQLREKLRVVEGRRLCLYTYHNKRFDKGEYHIALVPQFTQRGDLICALNGDSTFFAFREVIADEEERGDDASTVCNLVGMSYIERIPYDLMAFRTRLVLQ